jgi:hypothetical protein
MHPAHKAADHECEWKAGERGSSSAGRQELRAGRGAPPRWLDKQGLLMEGAIPHRESSRRTIMVRVRRRHPIVGMHLQLPGYRSYSHLKAP